MTDPIQFSLAVLFLLATPGPTNTLLLTAGAGSGIGALRLIPAEILGYLATILTIGYLVGTWVTPVPELALVLRVVVALYLCLLAVRLWRSGLAQNTDTQRLITLRDVLVTTTLNPKALVFALGIIPLHDPRAVAFLTAFIVMVAMIGSCWIGLGVAIQRGFLRNGGARLLPRVAAVVIAGFAGYVALAPLWRGFAA